MDIIRNFYCQPSSDYGDSISFIFNVDIVNQTNSTPYENYMVLLYVSRYPTQGRVKFWQDMRYVRYLGPGERIHITTTTGHIPKEEYVSLTVEVFRNGRVSDSPIDYRDHPNIYTGDLPQPVDNTPNESNGNETYPSNNYTNSNYQRSYVPSQRSYSPSSYHSYSTGSISIGNIIKVLAVIAMIVIIVIMVIGVLTNPDWWFQSLR